jgi:hypothetical protein
MGGDQYVYARNEPTQRTDRSGTYSSSVNIYFEEFRLIKAQAESKDQGLLTSRLGLAFTQRAPNVENVPGVVESPTFSWPGGTRLSLQIWAPTYDTMEGETDLWLTAIFHECKHAFAGQFFGDVLFEPLEPEFLTQYKSAIQGGASSKNAVASITWPMNGQWRLTREVWKELWSDQEAELHGRRGEKLRLKTDSGWSKVPVDPRQWTYGPSDLEYFGSYKGRDWRDWAESHATAEMQKKLTKHGVTLNYTLPDVAGMSTRLWRGIREKFRRAAKEEMFSKGSGVVDTYLARPETQ